MKPIRALFLLLSFIFSLLPNAGAGPMLEENVNKEELTEITTLAMLIELAKSAEARSIDNLANKLHFSYRSLGCHPTNDFSDFCQFLAQSPYPAFGQILILALGRDEVSGKTGGRVIWAAPSDGKCLSKESVLPLLGPGQPKVSDMAEPILGIPIPPVEREDYLYQSIPGGVSPARAVISFRNGCVNQMFLDF